MNPYAAAVAAYERQGMPSSIEADLWHHLQFGHVVSTPRVFAMFRPVASTWAAERLNDLTDTAPDGDAWFIWCLAGELAALKPFLPRRPKIGFARYRTKSELKSVLPSAIKFVSYDRARRILDAHAAGET
jgi:hypothetical protein